MNIVYERLREIPFSARVFTMTEHCLGWIVGGGAMYLLGKRDHVKDWDIIVPPSAWPEMCKMFPQGTQTNTWGGLKIDNVDVWPGDLANSLMYFDKNSDEIYAVQPRRQKVIVCKNGVEVVR